jgi:PIN domain nuclease of toxin-antitoxin system
MRLLLDTHIWMWSLLEPGRLGKRTVNALKNPDNELWLSPISVWELSILADKGRVKIDGAFDRWFGKALQTAPLREASFTFAVAHETRRLQLAHRDPTDRFLAATARTYGLRLLTADARLVAARTVPTLAN